jgi:mRNA-degrading endonuclease toxin of MazEF toxin-antitoxin module
MKADVGNLLFIEDKNDSAKKRPFMVLHVFNNTAGVPYDWLVVPITSSDSVGPENLVEVTHVKLACKSYAKLNNMETISWSDEIEVAKRKFAKKHIKNVQDRLGEILFKKIKDD